ncbi:DUF2500 domain-containing protein [Vibrio sp. ZSDZ34]|jgi:hypothetical protein|uniref:DUF2500 domain-containing protein n=1 Tax=Vibrio gelatinilyticus TaxID=2893468 RepID=A0A9X2AXS2_9VIBR|nr:DUF2500 domain-containing protein [Vibrio gelatinilyticus]MCJ2378731.1 DUF2500 domain-containing protein [Vibrio gelatinilyticus]
MPTVLILSIFILIIVAACFFSLFYTKHISGKDAPEQQALVTILDKQAVTPTDPDSHEEEYWIYVRKGRFGPKREFQIGVQYYHHLNPGDRGILTYQGQRFLHFALQRN